MLDINNAFINTIDANIIARKYMHLLEDKIISDINQCTADIGSFHYINKRTLDDIYDNFTQELEEESEQGFIRDWNEITENETVTENQIKKIYYELKKNRNKLSFTDADLIIKILCDYNN